MNFYSHAYVTTELFERGEFSRSTHALPTLILGSMLPDFATMSGNRLESVDDPVLAEGVALHHATDRAFHGAPRFVEWCRSGSVLKEAGLSYGASRACAHVGCELMLDAWLIATDSGHVGRYYRAALERAIPLATAVTWRDPEGTDRYLTLLARLDNWGVPTGYDDDRVVAERLSRILEGRPRLAFSAEQLPVVEAWARDQRVKIDAEAEALVEGVIAALSDAGPPESST